MVVRIEVMEITYEDKPMLSAKRAVILKIKVESHDGCFYVDVRVPDLGGGDAAALAQMKERLIPLFEEAARALRADHFVRP